MNKILISFVAVAVILIAAALVFSTYIKTEGQKEATNDFEPYRTTMEGEYVCLEANEPNVPSDGPCTGGIKTDSGEYYAVDMAAMSQANPGLQAGQRFSANGLVVPIERLSTDHWQKFGVKGIFSITDSVSAAPIDTGEPVMCTMDAKICPDGSAVGRQGPNCEFAACPTDGTTSMVTVAVGERATVSGVTIEPKAIVSDSRCPIDVTCVWAGTVEVRTVLSTMVGHGEHTMTLGAPQTFGEYTVTLSGVSPAKTQGDIDEDRYQLTFEVAK